MAPSFRYPQFCALARAAEVVGERWTILIVRELLLGPKRFSDLRERLPNITPRVLTERLGRAEELGLIKRSTLGPPVRATVYELTDVGRELKPAILELIRWGGRFLFPPRRGERIEPDWMRLALAACAKRGPSPSRAFLLRIRQGSKEAILHVAGGPSGTVVSDEAAPADATLVASVPAILALMSGTVTPEVALERRDMEAAGDLSTLPAFRDLFEATGRGGERDRAARPPAGVR